MSQQTVRHKEKLLSFDLIDWDPNTQFEALMTKLESMPGVRKVELNAEQNRLMVLGRVQTHAIVQAMEWLGIAVAPGTDEDEVSDKEWSRWPTMKWPDWKKEVRAQSIHRKQWIIGGMAIVLSFVTGILLSLPTVSPSIIGCLWLAGGIATALIAVEKQGVSFLSRSRRGGMDTYVIAGVVLVGSIVSGAWIEGIAAALLLVGMQLVTTIAVQRLTTRFVAPLDELPDTAARVTAQGEAIESPVGNVQPGDTVRVGSGQVVPLDGRVVSGVATIDASRLTGESIPYAKVPGDPIFAGASVLDGELELIVQRTVDGSLIRRCRAETNVSEAREEALNSLFGTVAQHYTAFAVYLALAVLIVPPLLLGGAIDTWLQRGLMLLAVAPANALIAATVVPMLAARTRIAEMGITVERAGVLRDLGRSSRLVFAQSVLVDSHQMLLEVAPCAGWTAEKALQLAASLSAESVHPIARAISLAATEQNISILTPWDVTEMPGRGIQGRLPLGHIRAEFRLGNTLWVEEGDLTLPPVAQDWIEEAAREGSRIIWLTDETEVLAALFVGERLLDGAGRLVDRLRRHGIQSMSLVTSAEPERAQRLAEQAGIDEVYAMLSLQGQTELLDAWRDAGERITTLGSTVDDRPSLRAADVNVWIGDEQLGIPQGREVFVLGHVTKVSTLVSLARRLNRVVIQSRTLAFVVQVLLVSLAITGRSTLWVLALAQAASPFVVLLLGSAILTHRR